MSEDRLEVGFLTEPTNDLLEEVNGLLPDLSERYVDEPIQLAALEAMAMSDDDLLLARRAGELVGIATIGYLETVSGTQAWLNDMVVGSEHQHKGHGGQLLRAVFNRAQQQGAQRIGWTSSWSRESAHGLYVKSGATIRESAVFNKEL